MRMEVIREYRSIRLWTNPEHSYVLSFKHPKYQKWWVCVSEEWWRKSYVEEVGSGTLRVTPINIEFARVIWAK